MTDEQLQEWEGLAEAATPGPWKSGWNWQDTISDGKSAWGEGPVHVGETLSQVAPQAIADAAFIAAAREAVPALVAEVRRLRAELEQKAADTEQARYEWGLIHIREQAVREVLGATWNEDTIEAAKRLRAKLAAAQAVAWEWRTLAGAE